MSVAERLNVENEPQVEAVNPVPSRTSEVVQYLNSEDSSGTKRKEQVKGGENGDERSYRANVAYLLRAARKSARECAKASKDNSIIDVEYPIQFQRKLELEKAQGDILDIERSLKQINPGGPLSKLNELLNKKQITELNVQMKSIIDKYGNLTKIQNEINFRRNIKDQMSGEFMDNVEKIEAEPASPKEILEKYYGEKLTEFQSHQKELLQIENRKPISIKEIVSKYNVFLMHGINSGPTAVTGAGFGNMTFKERLEMSSLEPAVSAFSYGENVTNDEMYVCVHLIFGNNTEVAGAASGDWTTQKRSFKERSPLGGFNRDKTIRDEIDVAIKKRSKSYNEFIVSGNPVGINIQLDSINYVRGIVEQITTALDLGYPLFGSKDGKMYEIEYDRTINPESNKWRKVSDSIKIRKEVLPSDIMELKSPINKQQQIEIAAKLIEKGFLKNGEVPNI